MASGRDLYSFVFLGFICGAPLTFSCVGELNANSWEPANVCKDKHTVSKTHILEKLKPIFLSTFFQYFTVTCDSDRQKENQKVL